MSNLNNQQAFLNYVRIEASKNPDAYIDARFVYALLIQPGNLINECFPYFIERYKNTNLNTPMYPDNNFLGFVNGEINGNEIKLYIPMDAYHIQGCCTLLFDFILYNNIISSSKIAKELRNDDVVVRVNTIEDANKIMDFIHNNSYIMEGLLPVNPFLTNNNGVGLAMDNSFSYNSTLCKLIADYYNELKQSNQLYLFNIQNLNEYIKAKAFKENDFDLKDIYTLLSKVTSPNFQYQDFLTHVENKSLDKYNDRKRIVEPRKCFERAVIATERDNPGSAIDAILRFYGGDSRGFTNEETKALLLRNVFPWNIIPIMREKLNELGIPIPNTDYELANNYVSLICRPKKTNEQNSDYGFQVIKQAYLNTIRTHNPDFARNALIYFLTTNNSYYFLNPYGDKDRLTKLCAEANPKEIILNNIDINNLDINNLQEIVKRFERVISIEERKEAKQVM